MVKRSLRIHV